MNRLIMLGLFSALWVLPPHLPAQEKPKSEERTRTPTPLKVQVVFTELDGEKKISSMPYSFMVISDEKAGGPYSASLRTGVRIPVETEGKEQKSSYSYLDLGSNIDCGARSEEDGRFRISLVFERSAIYPNKSQEGERLVAAPNGMPLVRQFRTSENLILKDGQSSDNIMSTDPLNGHVIRISVTINVQK